MPEPLKPDTAQLTQLLLTACKSSEPLCVLAAAVHPALQELKHQHTSLIAANQPDGSITGIAELYHYWQQQHPEAGRAYWAARSWTMLTWQAVSLSLIAVYAAQRSLDFSHFEQGYDPQSGIVSAYKKVVLGPEQQPHSQVLNETCQSLKQLLAGYYQQLQPLAGLHQPVAMRLVKDQFARFMLYFAEQFPQLKAESLNLLLMPWYLRLNLNSKSPFFELKLSDNKHTTLAKPSACCQHYLRQDGDYCLSCPKLSRAEQARRLSQHQQELLRC